MFYVYIITNKRDGVLYIGHTDNLAERMFQHKNKIFKGFSARYNLDQLVWFDTFHSRDEAFGVERRIKKWNRAWKIQEIEKRNADWRDLTSEIGWG